MDSTDPDNPPDRVNQLGRVPAGPMPEDDLRAVQVLDHLEVSLDDDQVGELTGLDRAQSVT